MIGAFHAERDAIATAPVSVVIPYYRNASTIAHAVSSAFDQTLPPYEVIIVDDGSDDGGAMTTALGALKKTYGDQLVIITLPLNMGPSNARNEGWQRATQPFVAFLDADDAWHVQKLELQVPVMLASDGPAISGHYSGINHDIHSQLQLKSNLEKRPVTFHQMLFRNRVSTLSVIVRRDVLPRFNPGMRHGEDYDLWLRVIAAHGPLLLLPYTLATTYKLPFGSSGLSSQLWAMQAGQAAVYRSLHRDGLTSGFLNTILLAWSFVRFARRILSTFVSALRPQRPVSRSRQ